MSTRGFVHALSVAAIVVALAGCSGDDPAPVEAPASALDSAGVYAYVTVEFGASAQDTQSELLVMDGTDEVGSSGPLFLADRPLFTTDGRYVFTSPAFLDEIVVISVDSGETTSVPCEGCGDRQGECQCQVVAPIGGSEIAWLAGPDNHLVRVDLAATPPTPEPTDITVPNEDGFLDEKVVPNLIAGTDGAALAAYPGVLPGDDLRPPYLVTLGEKPRRLDSGRPDSIDQAAFSQDGTRIALTGNQEAACATVTVVEVASGRGETAPVSAEPGATCDDKDVYVDSMWWDKDGSLHVAFEGNDEGNDGTGDGQARLDGGRWVETGGAGEVHRLDGGTAVIQGAAPGTLQLEADGERAEIDTDVRYLTAAP